LTILLFYHFFEEFSMRTSILAAEVLAATAIVTGAAACSPSGEGHHPTAQETVSPDEQGWKTLTYIQENTCDTDSIWVKQPDVQKDYDAARAGATRFIARSFADAGAGPKWIAGVAYTLPLPAKVTDLRQYCPKP
jgi:hypothetical protein